MNQYDPMKDNSTSQDTENSRTAGDTYSTSDRVDSDGRGYTNPDGSHGFIYNSRAAAAETRSRRYRGALIAVSAVLVTVLLASCCFFGALVAARSLQEEGDSTEGATEAGTSGELSIADGDESAAGESTDAAMETGAGDKSTVGTPNGTPTGSLTAPDVATIHKLTPKRSDKNGDGKADIELDADGQVLTSADRNRLSVATVFARVSASVVEITTETIVQSGRIGQYVTSGAGSGVIISAEGFIVTNNHVIEGASTITVRLSDGTEFPATLVGTDPDTDVAVLWIDAGSYALTVATLGSSYDLVVGEDILAIGNPLGSLGGTLTEGMISCTAREITVSGTNMTLLQVSAPINPGNSGGGLFNLAGELVGIVNAKMSSEEIEGLGFAIPVDTAYEVILELIEHGYVRGRPAWGFDMVDVTSTQTAIRYFNSFYTGVYVYDDGHDALQYGDLILAADGVEVQSASALGAHIRQKAVGDTVELTVFRNKEQITVTVTLVERVPETAAPAA